MLRLTHRSVPLPRIGSLSFGAGVSFRRLTPYPLHGCRSVELYEASLSIFQPKQTLASEMISPRGYFNDVSPITHSRCLITITRDGRVSKGRRYIIGFYTGSHLQLRPCPFVQYDGE
jgi:hypothetical protein